MKWNTLYLCKKCLSRLQRYEVFENSGVCPYCERHSSFSICDVYNIAYREVRERVFLWFTRHVRYEYRYSDFKADNLNMMRDFLRSR